MTIFRPWPSFEKYAAGAKSMLRRLRWKDQHDHLQEQVAKKVSVQCARKIHPSSIASAAAQCFDVLPAKVEAAAELRTGEGPGWPTPHRALVPLFVIPFSFCWGSAEGSHQEVLWWARREAEESASQRLSLAVDVCAGFFLFMRHTHSAGDSPFCLSESLSYRLLVCKWQRVLKK